MITVGSGSVVAAFREPGSKRGGLRSPLHAQLGEHVGKVVCVKDIAYVTSVSPSCFLKLSHADRTVSSKLESNDFLPLHKSYFVRTTLFEFTVTRSIDM